MNYEDDLIDFAQLLEMLGVSRGRAYTLSRDRTFPEPVIVRTRFRAWRRNEVEAWLDSHRPGWRKARGRAAGASPGTGARRAPG